MRATSVRRSAIIGTTVLVSDGATGLGEPDEHRAAGHGGKRQRQAGHFIAGYFLDVPGSHLAVTVQLVTRRSRS